MTSTAHITDESINMAAHLLNTMFRPSLAHNAGDIEIRTFKPYPSRYFFNFPSDAAQLAIELSNQGIDVYFGINPRTGKQGTKENIQYLAAFHAEIDYGSVGHKKETECKNYEEALDAIKNFHLNPFIIIHSGGGFHCYWVLKDPLKVADIGIVTLENINKALTHALKGDTGTHDISRVLRVPGTFNFKQPENPRQVEPTLISEITYKFEAFLGVLPALNDAAVNKTSPNRQSVPLKPISEVSSSVITSIADIDRLPVSDKIKFLIKNGNDGSYSSINLSVEAGLYQRLRMVAKLKRTSMSKLVRDGIRLKLELIDKENNAIIGGQ